jgi:hypothetical protein
MYACDVPYGYSLFVSKTTLETWSRTTKGDHVFHVNFNVNPFWIVDCERDNDVLISRSLAGELALRLCNKCKKHLIQTRIIKVV